MSKIDTSIHDNQPTNQEAAAILYALRLLNNEDQRIAYAILQGMSLQKRLDEQRNGDSYVRSKGI